MPEAEYSQLIAFLGERFTAIDRRFDAMEGQITGLRQQITGLRQELTELRQELTELRQEHTELRQEHTELRQELLGHFDELYRRLERIEGEYVAVTQALRRIEAGLSDDRGRRERLERDLATLRENVALLRARIDDIERRLSS